MPPTTRKRKKDNAGNSNEDTSSGPLKRSKKTTAKDAKEKSSAKEKARWIVDATHEKVINVRGEKDTRTCYISSSVLLFGDRLVVADFNNENCKLINTAANEILSELKLYDSIAEATEEPSKFWDLAVVSFKEVAATVPNINEVVVLKVGKREMRVERRIPVSGRCRGIAYMDQSFHLIFDDPVKFETITTQGEVLRTFDLTRSEIMTPHCFRLVQPYGQQMYVSDYEANWISLTTLKGAVKTKCTDFHAFSAKGLCTGLGGFVFACDGRGNIIRVLTGDLSKKIASLSFEGVKEPVSLTFCETTKHLYIGMEGDAVKVVKLSCTRVKN